MNDRVAILCRVSTQDQASEGQSLEVQEKTLRKCVEILNGTVVKEYIGHEHGTEGHERPILDELLNDARRKVYDALMVYDLSRLTRDPIRSKVILAELKKHGIKLYVQTQLYSLDNPETNLIVGLLSEINAFQASIQVQKSIESKIELAKRGWLVVGRPPFGRKLSHTDHSKSPEWILDEDKVALAQQIYDLYINQGVYVDKIGRLLEMEPTSVFRILKDKARLIQTFDFKGETIRLETPVPPLFTQEQQEQIKARLKRNKRDNARKNDYLLSGFVKCCHCGYTFIGITTNQGKNTYYRHSIHSLCHKAVKHIPRLILDRVVLDHIAEMVSNSKLLMETILQSNNRSIERKKVLEGAIKALGARQEKLQARRTKLMKLILDGLFTEEEATKEIDRIRKELTEISTELLAKQTELETLLNAQVPEEVFERVQTIFKALRGHYGHSITQWSFPVKRLLVEWFFGTNDCHGVWMEGTANEIRYTIKSNLGTLAFGWLEDDTSAGIDGQGGVGGASLPQFASIFQNLEPYTPKGIREHEHGFEYKVVPRWYALAIKVKGSLR
jgi:site-specific DNA recombinase